MKYTLVELKVNIRQTRGITLCLQSPFTLMLYPESANQTSTFVLAGVSPYTSLDYT